MSEEKGTFKEVYDALFGKPWKMWVGAILLSTFSICLYIIMSPWGASGGVLNWGQQLINPLFSQGTPQSIFENRYAMLCILILVGSFSSALLAKEFAIRIPPIGELVKGLVGGLIMGIGAIIGSSCTLGGFYSGWPALSVGAFVFTFGMVVGVFVAVLYLMFEAEKYPSFSSGESKTFLSGGNWQPIAGIVVFIVGLLFLFLFDPTTALVVMGFTFFGLLIGFVLQRSRFCIVRALREPFMTGESSAAVAVMIGIIVGLFGFAAIKFFAGGSPTMFVFGNLWISGLIGGILFGLGMTIAGGCVVGSLWRAGEGQVKLWFSVLGMFIALPITALMKSDLLQIFPAEMTTSTMYLPDVFGSLVGDNPLIGYMGAVLFVLAIIALWYIIVKWNERTGKLARM